MADFNFQIQTRSQKPCWFNLFPFVVVVVHLNRTHQDQKRTQKNKNPRESRIRAQVQERNHSSRRIGETLVILVRVCLCLCRNVLGIFKFYIQKTNENPILFFLLQRVHIHKIGFRFRIEIVDSEWKSSQNTNKKQTNKESRQSEHTNLFLIGNTESMNAWSWCAGNTIGSSAKRSEYILCECVFAHSNWEIYSGFLKKRWCWWGRESRIHFIFGLIIFPLFLLNVMGFSILNL